MAVYILVSSNSVQIVPDTLQSGSLDQLKLFSGFVDCKKRIIRLLRDIVWKRDCVTYLMLTSLILLTQKKNYVLKIHQTSPEQVKNESPPNKLLRMALPRQM